MPTTRPRHAVTESAEVSAALAVARRRWPIDQDSPGRLLGHLIEAGREAVLAELGEASRAHRDAILTASGALTGAFGPGYLGDLREDWLIDHPGRRRRDRTARSKRHPPRGRLARLAERAGERLGMSPISRAEVLVGPARTGLLDQALALLSEIRIEDVALPSDAAERLAALRATTGSTLPDCCVLLAAQQRLVPIATFDARLATSAERLGLIVLS